MLDISVLLDLSQELNQTSIIVLALQILLVSGEGTLTLNDSCQMVYENALSCE